MAIIKSKKNSKASKLNKKKTMKRNSKKNVSRKMRGGMYGYPIPRKAQLTTAELVTIRQKAEKLQGLTPSTPPAVSTLLVQGILKKKQHLEEVAQVEKLNAYYAAQRAKAQSSWWRRPKVPAGAPGPQKQKKAPKPMKGL